MQTSASRLQEAEGSSGIRFHIKPSCVHARWQQWTNCDRLRQRERERNRAACRIEVRKASKKRRLLHRVAFIPGGELRNPVIMASIARSCSSKARPTPARTSGAGQPSMSTSSRTQRTTASTISPPPSLPWLALMLLFACLALLAGPVQGHTIDLAASSKQCFFEDLSHEDVSVPPVPCVGWINELM